MLADTRDGLRTSGERTLDRLLGLIREVPAATAAVFQDELRRRRVQGAVAAGPVAGASAPLS